MKSATYAEKLLPTQEYFSHLFEDPSRYTAAIVEICQDYSSEFNLESFDLIAPKHFTIQTVSTPPAQLAIIDAIIRLTNAKTALEIGTFVGHSTMQIARMLGEGGLVTTIEIGEEFAEIAKKNFDKNGFSDQITLINDDALTALKVLNKNSFDLIYIDGDKENYLSYSLAAENIVTASGVIIVDDVFFHGDALSSRPETPKGMGCKKVLEHYKGRSDCRSLLLPIFNGMLLIFDFDNKK